MEHTIDFDGKGADIVATTSGRADTAGMKRMLDEIVSDERFRRGASLLSDHSALDFGGLTPTDIREISEAVSQLNDLHGFGPVAAVVSSPLAFGLARMGQTQLETDLRGRIFYSRDDAIEWIAKVVAGGGRELDG
jgi:hypothetical protein